MIALFMIAAVFLLLIGDIVQRYGQRGHVNYPSDVDFVVVTNEDLGLVANLTAATLNHFNTTIPYPQEWDPDNEVCVLYKIQFHTRSVIYPRDDNHQQWAVNMSYLDRNPAAATYGNVGSDTEDEYHKSIFAGPLVFGNEFSYPSAAAAVEVMKLPMNGQRMAEYVPEVPLSMFFPIYLDFFGVSASYALATGNETAIDTTNFENVEVRYFYRIRSMNSAERALQNALAGVPVRWAQLGS